MRQQICGLSLSKATTCAFQHWQPKVALGSTRANEFTARMPSQQVTGQDGWRRAASSFSSVGARCLLPFCMLAMSRFLTGRRSSLLQNQAYAQQFDSAAGSHTGSHDGPSSVRVYSHNDRDRLYETRTNLERAARVLLWCVPQKTKMLQRCYKASWKVDLIQSSNVHMTWSTLKKQISHFRYI